MAKRKRLMLVFIGLFISQGCWSNDLVYHPQNSAFGGSASATQVLLSKASAQNKKTEDNRKSAVERFQDQLERSILRQISRSITDSFDEDSENLTGRTFGSEEFTVNILTDNDESVVLQIENFTDGSVTTMTIPKI